MGRGGMFHLDLYVAVGGIHIVELFLTRGPQVGLFFRVQAFVDVEDAPLTTQEETQGIESGIMIVVFSGLHGKRVEQ